jgi:hypothetical protein
MQWRATTTSERRKRSCRQLSLCVSIRQCECADAD